ncbi:MAG: DUF975 family protein [Bacillota bacterium]|nr:DUF975 family protein [Bacillota bacterium]
MNVKISQIKKQARESLKGKWGVSVLSALVLFAIVELLPIFLGMILKGDSAQIGGNIFDVIYSIAAIPLSFAFYWFYLNMIRGNKPNIIEIFSIYKNGNHSLKVIGISLLKTLIILLWSILFVIPGIIKTISYSQIYFLIKDHPEYTVTQAIKESKKRMKGYKCKYFLLGLSFLGWGLLSMITLGIGLLWFVPYYTTSIAVFYNELIAPQDYNENKIEDIAI